jgi:hypothetical protein
MCSSSGQTPLQSKGWSRSNSKQSGVCPGWFYTPFLLTYSWRAAPWILTVTLFGQDQARMGLRGHQEGRIGSNWGREGSTQQHSRQLPPQPLCMYAHMHWGGLADKPWFKLQHARCPLLLYAHSNAQRVGAFIDSMPGNHSAQVWRGWGASGVEVQEASASKQPEQIATTTPSQHMHLFRREPLRPKVQAVRCVWGVYWAPGAANTLGWGCLSTAAVAQPAANPHSRPCAAQCFMQLPLVKGTIVSLTDRVP